MFEGWDAVVLARAQFAFTMSFHIVFPAFSIGLASYLAVLEALWLATGREVFINLFNYWLKIFAVAFGMGVVSAARSASRRRPRDVLDGDVDGHPGGADPDHRRRPAWAQHAGASAYQDHGDGRPFRQPQGRRAADFIRLAGSSRGQGQICG